MALLGWTVPRLGDGGDVLRTTRLTLDQIRDVAFERTHENLLASLIFIARYTDDHARARCSFVEFGDFLMERQPGLAKGR